MREYAVRDSEARHMRSAVQYLASKTHHRLGDTMRRTLLGFFLALAFTSMADARCVGSNYRIRLGTELSIHRDTDGAPCVHNVGGSRDPIYGTDIRTKPKHGSLNITKRTTIVYRPSPGFKGEDSYSFQWVGKQGGSTPSAMTINVAVTVK